MGKITTLQWKDRERKLEFKYNVSVDSEGMFSTTLPEDVVEKLKSCKIQLKTNRQGREGYIYANTLEGLMAAVNATCNSFCHKKKVKDKIILKYSFDITCSYCKGKKGIYPNGGWQRDAEKGEEYHWVNGTRELHAAERSPYGMRVGVIPYKRVDFVFPDGTTTSDYTRLECGDYKEHSTLHWLNSLCGLSLEGEWSEGSEIFEIDYTEEVGLFFRGILESIFELNERFKAVFGDTIDLSKADFKKMSSLSAAKLIGSKGGKR